MASKKRKAKLKEWLLGFFSPKEKIRPASDGPQRSKGPGNFISHAQNFALHNPTMTAIQGDQYTVTYVRGDRNSVPQVMKFLSDHIILGAAHDDSARVPPPRCHPGTRINLISRITAWFNGDAQHELLLWITGPAGVGKSAVVQTFAEHLSKLKQLGASVFCSRSKRRNNPHGIFITVAYQLAVRIGAYREFIVERLSLDPQLLNRDIETQFVAFIVEPFVEKKIGSGGTRWGILLDGLDELQGDDAQCEIIHLISAFAHEHRNTPLVWIIASRPEPHISDAFNDDANRNHWSEYIPIDSTEACEDVDRFLRSNFETTRRKFRQSIPRDWPSKADFLKLADAASGLFIYAEVVMRFIRDRENADPVSQFEIVLSFIDHSNSTTTSDYPFAPLDALYHEILSSIPPKLWPTTKRLLRFLIYQRDLPSDVVEHLRSLRGNSILFGLTQHVIYACLMQCHSMLGIPDWKVAHQEKLTILHTSFADYLTDSSRSGEFYVGSDNVAYEDLISSLVRIWDQCGGPGTPASSMESKFYHYCSHRDNHPPSRAIAKFHTKLFRDVVFSLRRSMLHHLRVLVEPPIYALLNQVHMVKLCYYFNGWDLVTFVNTLMNPVADVGGVGLLSETTLRDIKFGHLDWKEMSPAYSCYERNSRFSKYSDYILHRPRSSAELKAFVFELKSLQECSPKLKVVIVGGVSQGRVATLRHALRDEPDDFEPRDFMYYVIPYPQDV